MSRLFRGSILAHDYYYYYHVMRTPCAVSHPALQTTSLGPQPHIASSMSASKIAAGRLSRRNSRATDAFASTSLEPLIAQAAAPPSFRDDDAPKERRRASPSRKRSSTPERFRRALSALSLSRRNKEPQPNEHGIFFKSSNAHLGDAETLVVVAVDFGTARTGYAFQLKKDLGKEIFVSEGLERSRRKRVGRPRVAARQPTGRDLARGHAGSCGPNLSFGGGVRNSARCAHDMGEDRASKP